MTYVCKCENYECEIATKRNDWITDPPPVCVMGKNIRGIVNTDYPNWKIKGL